MGSAKNKIKALTKYRVKPSKEATKLKGQIQLKIGHEIRIICGPKWQKF